MKIKNWKLVQILNILEQYKGKKLPQKISYAIGRNILILSGVEYQSYRQALECLMEAYKDRFVLDDKGGLTFNENGVPVVHQDINHSFEEELNGLLDIEVELNLYHIEPDIFDYDDKLGRYDVLTSTDILTLQSVLCSSV